MASIVIRNSMTGAAMVITVARRRRALGSVVRNMRAAGWPSHAIARALSIAPARVETLVDPFAAWRALCGGQGLKAFAVR